MYLVDHLRVSEEFQVLLLLFCLLFWFGEVWLFFGIGFALLSMQRLRNLFLKLLLLFCCLRDAIESQLCEEALYSLSLILSSLEELDS